MYSEILSGVANTFRKLRDHMSSNRARVTPCMTRVRKPQSSTAPNKACTSISPGEDTPAK